MHLRWAVRCSERGESSVSYYSPLQPVPSKSCDRPGNSHPSDLASIFMCFWCSICGLPILCLSYGCQSVVWSGVGHLHVMSVTGRCSFSSFHEESHTFYQTGLMLTLEGTLQYLSLVLPVCISNISFWLVHEPAIIYMWVLVKLSTCVATCYKCNSCLSTNVEAIALLLHSSSVGACCHAWKHLCFQSAWPVFFRAVDSN